MKINRNNTGVATEKLAVTFKTLKGLKLVAQDYHCRSGGADLIMKEGNKNSSQQRIPFCKPIKTAPVVLMWY